MLLDGADAGALQQAAEWLVAGELVAFPTETVYGLGARAPTTTPPSRRSSLPRAGRPIIR